MIEAINKFTLSGIVYDDPIKRPLSKNAMYSSKFYTSFVLVVGHSPIIDCRIPIVCVNDCADKAFAVCRKGSYVAIQGKIISKEIVDKESGDIYITPTLVGYQIQPLLKPKEKSLKRFNFRDVVVSCDPKNYSEIARVKKRKE